jgi:hypothetical protein
MPAAGRAPAVRRTSLLPTKSASVGREWIPNRWATAGSASVFSLSTITWPASAAATFASSGAPSDTARTTRRRPLLLCRRAGVCTLFLHRITLPRAAEERCTSSGEEERRRATVTLSAPRAPRRDGSCAPAVLFAACPREAQGFSGTRVKWQKFSYYRVLKLRKFSDCQVNGLWR